MSKPVSAPYIGGRPAHTPDIIALSSTVEAWIGLHGHADDRVTLVREGEERDAVISLTAQAEAALLALLLKRRGLAIEFLGADA